MVLHITRYFYKKFGGENTIFVLNRMRLLDEKIYIAPVEGFVLSRIEEYPTVSKLTKILTISKVEIFLIIDKLYKLGLLHVGGSEKNKTEIMENNILNILLSIYKRQLTGELEVVSNTMSGRLFFEGGVLKFIYSTTPEYSLARFFQEKDGFFINVENASDEISSVLIKYMEKNGYSFEKTKSIMEIYSNMIFYELLQGEILSAIFIHENKFPINLGLDFKILFMLMLAVINNKLKISNHINKNVSYELTRSEDNIEEEFDNIGLITQLLANFSEGKLDRTKIAALSEYELSALNLLYSIGFIKEVEFSEISLEELSVYLNQIKAKAPYEIFEVDPDKYDIETVKQKFLKLSKTYHPDLITDKDSKQVAREIFEIIKYAYDTLIQNVANETKKKVDIRNILLAEQLLSSGKVYMNMGRINDAIEAFIKSHNAFSDDEEIKIYYGYALIRKGDYENGLKIISMIGVDKYEDPELYAALIESYIKLGKKAEAKRYLEKVLVKFPDKARRFSALSSRLK
jgi:tetratricopeptide (TPR) repeat protein/putative sterol carrier protein